MSKALVPCPSCARHVRATELSCPFCATALEADASRVSVVPSTRLGRAALFAFGTTLATISTAACGTATNADASAQDVQNDMPNSMAIYGAPTPIDSGVTDSGSPGARYGAVPPEDAG
jgi:hypothetical protein